MCHDTALRESAWALRQAAVEHAVDFSLDRSTQQAQHRPELQVDVGVGLADVQSAREARTREGQRIALPGQIAQPEAGGEVADYARDGFAAALLAERVRVVDVDDRHVDGPNGALRHATLTGIPTRPRMRVVGVHPAREPVSCSSPVRIGSAPDDTVVLAGEGVVPHHLSVVADARGLVLDVQSGGQRVYVNARAVHERALLHYGDVIAIGAHRLLLTVDTEPAAPATAVVADSGTPHAALRVASGVASGRRLAVAPELHLGAGGRYGAELGYACHVVQSADGLAFESESAASRVNGWPCRRARLAPGDQLVLGEHHLIVEAPGLEYAAHQAALPPPVVPVALPPPDEGPHTEVWWLIVAAAVLAAVIALFLYFRW